MFVGVFVGVLVNVLVDGFVGGKIVEREGAVEYCCTEVAGTTTVTTCTGATGCEVDKLQARMNNNITPTSIRRVEWLIVFIVTP